MLALMSFFYLLYCVDAKPSSWCPHLYACVCLHNKVGSFTFPTEEIMVLRILILLLNFSKMAVFISRVCIFGRKFSDGKIFQQFSDN